MVINGQGICAWGRGDFAEAAAFFRELRDLKLDCTEPNMAADAANNLALIEWKLGRLREALDLFREALRLRRRAGDRFASALTRMNLGIIEENLGHTRAAEKHYLETLKVAQEIQFAQVVAAAHGNLANLRLAQERGPEALDHSARSLEEALRIGDRRSAAIALENLTLSNILLGQFDDARKSLGKARRLARRIGDAERLFSLDLVDIEIRITEGRSRGVRKKLSSAAEVLEASGYQSDAPRLLRLSAQAYQNAGRPAEAKDAAKQCLTEARRQGNRCEEDRIRKVLLSLGD